MLCNVMRDRRNFRFDIMHKSKHITPNFVTKTVDFVNKLQSFTHRQLIVRDNLQLQHKLRHNQHTGNETEQCDNTIGFRV